MSECREILVSLAWRAVLFALLVAAGLRVIFSAPANLSGAFVAALMGMALIVAAAIVVASPLARLFAHPFGNLFYPEEYDDKPPPMYDLMDAMRKRGQIREAFDGYQQIIVDDPHAVRAYLAMIEIAIVHFKDPALANEIFARGQMALRGRKDDLKKLTEMNAALTSMLNHPHRPQYDTGGGDASGRGTDG